MKKLLCSLTFFVLVFCISCAKDIPQPLLQDTTVQDSIAVSKNAGMANTGISPNTSNQRIMSIILQNQSITRNYRIKNLQIGLTNDGTTALTTTTVPSLGNFTNLKASEQNATVMTSIASPQAVNNFTVDLVLGFGETRTIDVIVTTGATINAVVIGTFSFTASDAVTGIPVDMSLSAVVIGQRCSIGISALNDPIALIAASTASQYIASGIMDGLMTGSKEVFNISATNAGGIITELKYMASSPVATSVTVNGVSAPFVAGVAWITGLAIQVPRGGGGMYVEAFLNYAPIGGGILSATQCTLSLTYIKYISGGIASINAYQMTWPSMTVVASKPVIVINITQQTGFINNAENKIGQVVVAADSKGDISVGQIIFDMTHTGFGADFAISAVRLVDDNGIIAGLNYSVNNPLEFIACMFSVGYTIPAGTSRTFTLYGVVKGTIVGGTTVAVYSKINQKYFLWTDITGNGVLNAENGALIWNFPDQNYLIKQ